MSFPFSHRHKLQPCDFGVFSVLKNAYRDQAGRLDWQGEGTVGKERFTYLYSSAREIALTTRNTKVGWAATGLFPFRPEKVLRKTPKLPAELITSAGVKPVGSCPQVRISQTPMTLVRTDALTSSHNTIKQDAVDQPSKMRQQRCIQKLTRAAQISYAECALLQDQGRLLSEVTKEVKVRRSTKLVVHLFSKWIVLNDDERRLDLDDKPFIWFSGSFGSLDSAC